MSFHVLIAGGGIGGLCLAQGLRRNGISCALYEATPGIGRAGYRLHMNAAGGGALQECLPANLYELYMQTSRKNPRRETFTMVDHLGNELGARPHIGPPNDAERPHTAVNRRTLRQIMCAGLGDVLHFGHTVTGYELDGQKVRLQFADGSSAEGDVLVAADGINSVIRGRRLPEVAVLDTGMRGLYSMAPVDGELLAELPPPLLDGFVQATGPGATSFSFGLFDPRRPIDEAAADLAPGIELDPINPYFMINFSIRLSDAELFSADQQRLHDEMRSAVREWVPAIRKLVDRVDPASIFPTSIRHLAPAEPWAPSRVTLLGDAIHAMPPTFGAGANSALRDAGVLAGELGRAARGDKDLLTAIGDFEANMRAEVFPILRASVDPRAIDHDFLPDDIPVVRR
ncbi:FAD-dependent monooxygenase [Nonomuraea sp. FMUSA5-5]|uniref:FAD-dependent monooxygenase n=1 Tax=Nonomuraea composti TaxID=2720023 RepID=A0ABX1BL57_9ACTN|nr:FAD-dependent monooxygenase [Nonomuraea sp. FMUSA5-5]NJP98483.1 FAD-dependent monooxygenase [Nonomuraea sp. FMUSA5-5]